MVAGGRRVGRRRPGTTTDGAAQPEPLHQTLDGAARDLDLLTPELSPHLTRPIHLVMFVPDSLNFRPQLVIPPRPRRALARIAVLGAAAEVRRWSDRQPFDIELLDLRLVLLKGEQCRLLAQAVPLLFVRAAVDAPLKNERMVQLQQLPFEDSQPLGQMRKVLVCVALLCAPDVENDRREQAQVVGVWL